ncbi:E3 ubiquitin-protein ligase ATL42 [Morus notabilis]|uniref:RING-type E3 ubiquitin transferase n=1 Tax=Morus notabilis TaxID=981085 RepID=W9SDP5_9ROSA|nr:E3 ubiquitin-protein ligase ATL42 [Morus notabilis]EXC37516.1 E3 ubiquitin-protein ligase ATL42 [Morus notabilis]
MHRVLVNLQPFNFSMNGLKLIVLHLILLLFHVEAQTIGPDFSTQDNSNNFQPSLLVVIGILGVMFVFTFLILVYAKVCHSREPVGRNSIQNRTGLISSSGRFSGIDKTVIESLPFFRFSSLKGSKEGLECVVCLSKFEDIEVLRMLPKCRHAFHINCIDHWLEKHSSCPLCRHKVSSEDLKLITYSNSMRFLWNNQSERREDSNNKELFVEREGSHRGSSRFSIGGSFRKIHEKGHNKEEELLILQENEEDQNVLHKHNHKILASDFVFNNRWSNLRSSDLMFLNSEMLNEVSSGRFSSTDWNIDMSSTGNAAENEEIMKAKETEMKKSFESKDGRISTSDGRASTSSHTSRSMMNSGEQRSVSEITSFSRYGSLSVKNRNTDSSSWSENNVKEERIRRVWLPIARRTVQWFANGEKRSQSSNNPQSQPLDV